MCGRFVSASPPDQIAAYFDADVTESVIEPSWNVAPTDPVYGVIVDDDQRRLTTFRWGLVPMWAKDLKIGSRMINARAETLADMGAFRSAFERRRCIIPADGFYEWRKTPGSKVKQPVFIHPPDGGLYAFGGVWERWRNPDDPEEIVRTCSIITGAANEKMAELHDRMPLILPPELWEHWLDPAERDVEALGELLVVAPSELITFRLVSSEVGNVANNGAHLIDEIDDPHAAVLGRRDEEQLGLFDEPGGSGIGAGTDASSVAS